MTFPYVLLYLTVLSCVAMLAYRLGRRSVIWGAPPAPKVEETYSRAQVDELLEKMNQRLKMHWSHEKHRYMLCSKYGPPKNDFDSKHDNARALNKTVFDDLRARMGDADGAFVRLEWSYVNDYNHVKDDWIQAPLTGKADVVIDQIIHMILGKVAVRDRCLDVSMVVTLPRKADNIPPHRVERVYLRASGEPGAVELSPDEIEARRKAEQEVERVLEATKRVMGKATTA